MVSVGLRKYGEEIGLKVVDGSVCGKYQGFFVRMFDTAGFKRIEIKNSPLNDEQMIKLDNFINTIKGQCRISNYSVLTTGVVFYISDTVGTMKVIKEFLPAMVEHMISIEALPLTVCGICGENIDGLVSFCFRGDTTIIGHKKCLEKPEEKPIEKQIEEISKSYGSGYFGAFLGMVVGIIPWVLISLIGFIAAIGGYIISVAVKFGYEKLGGKVGKPKITAIILFSVLGVILATIITWTISYHGYITSEGYNISIIDALLDVLYFSITPEGAVEVGSDLLMGLGFAALGSWSFISQEYKNVKNETLQPIAYTLD